MKKYPSLLLILLTIMSCKGPERRSWIVPVKTDPSDLQYTPEISDCFEKRRTKTLEKLGKGVLVLYSEDQDSHSRHGFRVNNYFFYLSGLEIPGAMLVLDADSEYASNLILPPDSPYALIYHGAHFDALEIRDTYGLDRVWDFEQGKAWLDSLLEHRPMVYGDTKNKAFSPDFEFEAANEFLDEQRKIKDRCEVARMQKACDITSQALLNVMRACESGRYEFEMEAILEGTFMQYGSPMPGFPSIMGSGPNSTILHYEASSRLMEDGDLLLMDVGAEYGNYTADITRTIPVNGKFSKEQATIYQLVLDAQQAAIEVMKPGADYMEGHSTARKIIIEGLSELGLITDPASEWQQLFYVLYPSSHFLGLDVHDVGKLGLPFRELRRAMVSDTVRSIPLEAGMVLTIEPGLYFREKGLDQIHQLYGHLAGPGEIDAFIETVAPIYKKYANIGVRIEDDILITREGNLNLSRYAPREIEDIEALMRY